MKINALATVSFLMVGTICVAAIMVGLSVWIATLWFTKPSPKVDYITQYAQLGRPNPYDESQNGALVFMRACAVAIDMPDDARWGPSRLLSFEEDEVEELGAYVEANTQALGLLRQCVAMPCFWMPAMPSGKCASLFEFMSSVDTTSDFRRLLYAASGRMMLDAYCGNADALASDFESLCGCTRQFHHPRTLLDVLLLVGSGSLCCNSVLGALQTCEVTPEQLVSLRASVTRMQAVLDDIEQHELEGERFFVLDEIQRVFTDDGKGDGRLAAGAYFRRNNDHYRKGWKIRKRGVFAAIYMSATCPGRKQTISAVDRACSRYMELMSTSPWQLRQQQQSYDGECEKIYKGYAVLDDEDAGEQSTAKVFELYHRYKGIQSGTEAVIAILQYRAAEGTLPEGLQEVVKKGYLKIAPMDPYSGKDMVYRKTADGFMLYSLGENVVDDGGVSNFGKPSTEGDDVYWPRFETPRRTVK